MAEGRQKMEWQQTSSLLAMIYNANRDPKKQPLDPSDFDPTAKKKKPMKIKVTMLKGIMER